MSLQAGQTLLHYQIVEKIGEGGMGEVYRAGDRKLGRDVAIKVLPHELSDDPERLARFQREAQVLALLNHPSIGGIYGLEEVDGTHFLVLELVEGDDLAVLLGRGALPVEQALDVARQIADALEAAHEQGIVHRDLKPANVKRTPDGKVKVLDFGLAKALDAGGTSDLDASRSPTITSAATRDGVIMGTAAYMSPEQARGSAVDKRADIWAFGCVLLELLTGRNPFVEGTISDTLASVLRSDPDWKNLPRDTPPALRRLLRRCLDKDPRQRLRDIGEARVTIEGIVSGAVGEEDAAAAVEATRGRRGSWAAVAVAVAAAIVAAVVTATVLDWQAPSATEAPIRRFDAIRGSFGHELGAGPRLSPDGRKVLFMRDGQVWIRRLDQLEPQRLEGTDEARLPVWSPDSESIVFSAKNDLKTVPIAGGSVSTIAIGVGRLDQTSGLSWGGSGRIVFSGSGGGILEVSARGGEPREILAPDKETEIDFHQTCLLPDGSLLFVVHREGEGADTLDVLAGGERKTVLRVDSGWLEDVAYSATGHIVFRRSRAKSGLWAVPFSLSTLEVSGEPFLVTAEGSHPSTADDGALLYVQGASSGLNQLVWVDREGTIAEVAGPPQAGIESPALSPDGKQVAVMARESEAGNIWIYDLARQTRTRLSFGNGKDWDPAWTPDGEHIVYWDGTIRALMIKAADGTGEARRLVEPDLPDSGTPTFTPDGETMVFWAVPSVEEQDLWVARLDGDGAPTPLLATQFDEELPRLSPDGRLLAYTSNESGQSEVYLTRFPSTEGKWQVSVEGGTFPVWSSEGDELFYREGSILYQVDVVADPAVRLGTPRVLFDAVEAGVDVLGSHRFDVSRDGRRLLMVQQVREQGAAPRLVLAYGWSAPFADGAD